MPVIFPYEWVEIVCLSAFIAIKYDLVSALFVYTVEVYNTELRNSSVAYMNTQSRLIVALVPYILMLLIEQSTFYAFLFFVIMEAFCVLAILTIPYETQGTRLDTEEDEKS